METSEYSAYLILLQDMIELVPDPVSGNPVQQLPCFQQEIERTLFDIETKTSLEANRAQNAGRIVDERKGV
jgi:hypothetical protein